MTLVQASSAYANQNAREAKTEEVTSNPEESPSTSTDSRVTGHIRVGLISAITSASGLGLQIDTRIPFQVDSPGVQIQSPGIQIRNLSVVPIKLEVSQVAEIKNENVELPEKFSDQIEQSFQLVDRISSAGTSETVILVLGEEDGRYNETNLEKDIIMSGKKNTFITDTSAEKAGTLKPYGKVAPDFYGEYQLTVRPTLKIGAIQADPFG